MPDRIIKDQYGDEISVTVSASGDGAAYITATEKNVVTPGEATLILSNKQRKQLRRALKRSAA